MFKSSDVYIFFIPDINTFNMKNFDKNIFLLFCYIQIRVYAGLKKQPFTLVRNEEELL